MEAGENGLHGHHVIRTAGSEDFADVSNPTLPMEAQIVLVILIRIRNVVQISSSSPDLRRWISVIGILMSSKFWPLEVEEER